MTKKRVAVAATAVLVFAGAVYVAVAEGYLLGTAQAHAHGAAFDAMEKAHLLRMLRRGETAGAIDALESGLNTDVLAHSAFDPEMDRHWYIFSDTARTDARVMAFVAAYRDEFPRTEGQRDLSALVAKALRKYPPIKCQDSKQTTKQVTQPGPPN
jgi:hypothetical protein